MQNSILSKISNCSLKRINIFILPSETKKSGSVPRFEFKCVSYLALLNVFPPEIHHWRISSIFKINYHCHSESTEH